MKQYVLGGIIIGTIVLVIVLTYQLSGTKTTSQNITKNISTGIAEDNSNEVSKMDEETEKLNQKETDVAIKVDSNLDGSDNTLEHFEVRNIFDKILSNQIFAKIETCEVKISNNFIDSEEKQETASVLDERLTTFMTNVNTLSTELDSLYKTLENWVDENFDTSKNDEENIVFDFTTMFFKSHSRNNPNFRTLQFIFYVCGLKANSNLLNIKDNEQLLTKFNDYSILNEKVANLTAHFFNTESFMANKDLEQSTINILKRAMRCQLVINTIHKWALKNFSIYNFSVQYSNNIISAIYMYMKLKNVDPGAIHLITDEMYHLSTIRVKNFTAKKSTNDIVHILKDVGNSFIGYCSAFDRTWKPDPCFTEDEEIRNIIRFDYFYGEFARVMLGETPDYQYLLDVMIEKANQIQQHIDSSLIEIFHGFNFHCSDLIDIVNKYYGQLKLTCKENDLTICNDFLSDLCVMYLYNFKRVFWYVLFHEELLSIEMFFKLFEKFESSQNLDQIVDFKE